MEAALCTQRLFWSSAESLLVVTIVRSGEVGENRGNKISEMLVSAEIKWEIHYAIPYAVFNFCACLNFS